MPKKVYAKSNLDSKSMCRLCCSIIDPKHCKNLYNKASVNVLASAELLYGGKLLRGDSLPHLVCRPCERRLDNFMKFKNMICDNQDSMMRQKRCIELSPSAPTADEKSAKTDTLIRGKSSQSRPSLSSSFETYDLPTYIAQGIRYILILYKIIISSTSSRELSFYNILNLKLYIIFGS